MTGVALFFLGPDIGVEEEVVASCVQISPDFRTEDKLCKSRDVTVQGSSDSRISSMKLATSPINVHCHM